MGFLQNYLGLEPAYKDGYDLPLLGMMKSLHRDRPGADGFGSGHQGTHFGITGYQSTHNVGGRRDAQRSHRRYA
jgi:hypothetical protein